jgi:predicted nuclease of predicted toxin-antitoxin system
MAGAGPIRFFLDNCVPESVGRVLEAAGHEVLRLRDHIAPNSPDEVVATLCDRNELVLVSLDKDFDSLHTRAGVSRRRYRKLRRIKIACSEPQAATRIKSALSLIEHEFAVSETSADKRMFIEIGHTRISTIR